MQRRLEGKVSSFFFEYDTPGWCSVRNKKVGVTFRLIQLVVLVYVIGWVFLYEKGYQSADSLISSVSVKFKGLTVTNVTGMGPHIWDVADYVFPPQGSSSFVVMTNFILTTDQQQGNCPELPQDGTCQNDQDCPQGLYKRTSQGIKTGRCVSFNKTVKTCEVFAWCPLEVDDNIPDPPLLQEAENFTLFIKNSISFPRFKVNRRNLVESIDNKYLKNCLYHKTRDPLCPVFKLGYIVSESGQDFRALALKGGVVGITIDWNCDLDWPVRFCKPVYQFHSLYDEGNKISSGFNFRFARYYTNGTSRRKLFKVFGIQFDIMVDGKAGKFDIIPTMTTIGSGIGIFGVATVLCDLLLLHILPKRHYYKQKKFKYAEEVGPGPDRQNLAAGSSREGLKTP
ncbi:P2X purinoceptor 1 [Ornithorhynchus anatinus]|uniref:P2X purinoceptor 1 n=1 Tax=Ornithorhynchus anatinus TaxID=9258 RepID=UPI0010A75C91|nr:P2X purinoceptor 1 [Ornithorhynchus anatinus]